MLRLQLELTTIDHRLFKQGDAMFYFEDEFYNVDDDVNNELPITDFNHVIDARNYLNV